MLYLLRIIIIECGYAFSIIKMAFEAFHIILSVLSVFLLIDFKLILNLLTLPTK